MPRIISDKELKHLTIPRLQNLLKATRARANSTARCDCCGESYAYLYGDDHPRAIEAAKLFNYFNRVKSRLQELQKTI